MNIPIHITSRDSVCILPSSPPQTVVVESNNPNEGMIPNDVPLNDSMIQSPHHVIVSQITTTTMIPNTLVPVQYKDQTRSVIPSATGVLVDPNDTDIPFVAVALDVSTPSTTVGDMPKL